MTKHLGNVLEPIPLMDAHGADAVRWFMAAGGSPWQARRVGHAHDPGGRPQDAADLLEHGRRSRSLYAAQRRLDAGRRRARRRRPAGARPVGAVRGAPAGRRGRRRALEGFDTQRAGRLLAAYVDDLSNWYVRRSRRRFWAGDPAALATLHECLYVVTLLMAPLTPFITERVWQDLFARDRPPSCPTSVHLAAWPRGRRHASSTTTCATQMALVRRLVELGRAARADVQGAHPAAAAAGRWSRRPAWDTLPTELRAEVAEELNVGRARTARRGRRRPGRRHGEGATSARWASGSASRRPRWQQRSPPPTPPRSPRRCDAPATASVVVDGEQVEVLGPTR